MGLKWRGWVRISIFESKKHFLSPWKCVLTFNLDTENKQNVASICIPSWNVRHQISRRYHVTQVPESQDVIISDYVTLLSALLWALLFLSELYHLDISACQWIMQTSVSVSLLHNLSICRDVKSKQIKITLKYIQQFLFF